MKNAKHIGKPFPWALLVGLFLVSLPAKAEQPLLLESDEEGFGSEGAFQIPPNFFASGQALFVPEVATGRTCEEAINVSRDRIRWKVEAVADECRDQGGTPRYADTGKDKSCAVRADEDEPFLFSRWTYVRCIR